MKQYPAWTDFPIDDVMYGLHAPYVGIGTYTLDRKFSWPDPECTSEREFKAWAEHLKTQGFEIPEAYRAAFIPDRLAKPDLEQGS